MLTCGMTCSLHAFHAHACAQDVRQVLISRIDTTCVIIGMSIDKFATRNGKCKFVESMWWSSATNCEISP